MCYFYVHMLNVKMRTKELMVGAYVRRISSISIGCGVVVGYADFDALPLRKVLFFLCLYGT